MSTRITLNNREILSARSTITGQPEYLTSTSGALNINATISSVGIATSANQTDGSQKTQIVDAGGEAVTVTGGKLDVNATASLAGQSLPISSATTAVGVAIVDSSGNQISSFGGGIQYEDGDIDATPTGTVSMWLNTGDDSINAVSDTAPLPVRVDSGTVSIDSAELTSIDGKTPALGQALAAASVPVILPSATITTLTPPAAITGFATSAKQDSLLTELQLKADLTETQPVSLASVPSHEVTNAGVFAVQATLAAESTKVIGTVNQGTSPWVTSNATTSVVGNGAAATAQRVTLANDSTGVIATVGAVTAITNALPAGTNAIGKLAANSGVDIGDVDVTTVGTITPGTAATSLGKAEDAAHASGDVGVMSLAVRNDNASTTFGADGDYSPIAVDLKGRSSVRQVAPTATLSNVSSSATSVTVLAANSSRVAAMVYNDSTQVLYLKFGTTASATSFTVPLATNTYYEVPGGYTGIIDGIWASANGNARVTEIV